jgi:hypothetical protein
MILLIIIFLLLGFFPFINASLAMALDRGLSKGMIFEKYRVWLAKKLLGKKLSIPGIREDSELYREELLKQAEEKTFFYKPLGGCIHCFAIWMSIPVYLVLNAFIRHLFELGLMPCDLCILEYWHILIWFAYASISELLISKLN